MDNSLLPQFKGDIGECGFWTLIGVCALVFGSYLIAFYSGRNSAKRAE